VAMKDEFPAFKQRENQTLGPPRDTKILRLKPALVGIG